MTILFFGYIIFIWKRYGIQSSVSESYYRLPRNLQWLFTIATWGYALPAMIIGLDFTGNGLVFLAGTGIAFVGASPAFKGIKMEHTVHLIGALVGITAAQLFLIVEGYWYVTLLFAIFSGLAFIIKYFYMNFIWWIEILAFLSIWITFMLMAI
jgi:hypothetical protein